MKSLVHSVRRMNSAPFGKAALAAGRRYATSAASSNNDTVVITRDAQNPAVAIVTLNRPDKLNALTVEMGTEFTAKMQQLRAECIAKPQETRAVVLTGAGRAFSAGGDMQFLLERSKDAPHNNAQTMLAFYSCFLGAVRTLPVPTLSAINGHAIGAGLCLALATDIRVATMQAKLGLTFANLGLHPGMGATHFLPRLVGHQVASYLLLTGDVVNGDKAKEMGLILEYVDTDKNEVVLEHTLKIARSIAKNPYIAVNTCTQSLRQQQNTDLERNLNREADAQAQSYASTELRQRVEAMINKSNK